MQKILLVDDDTDLLIMLKRSLAKYGYQVTTLSDPSGVVDFIKLILPAIVILDINMGEYDGREICKILKSQPDLSQIPIVLYSALEDGAKSLAICKADLFLQKPLTAETLVSKLETLQKTFEQSL